MRPLKIEMQYFGPYDHATVDFTKFNQHSLILISGNTGAGKTTIFDAMSYALFGQTTNDRERSATALRSDFAPANQETRVVFTFVHQGSKYQITRKPKQALRGRQGKTVVHNQAVELIYPLDSDQPHAITKIKTADAFVTNLLNLTQDQFRQIVLLPQGKFRQFLDADSNSKATLLRDLFNTNRYARWAQELKDELNTRKQKLSDQENKLQAIKETVTDLDAGLAADDWQVAAEHRLTQLKQRVTTLHGQATTQQATVDELNQQFHKQEELQKAIIELATVRQQARELAKHREVIETTKKRVANLEWFQGQQAAYQRWQDGEKQLTTWRAKAKQLAAQLKKLTTVQQQAQQDYQACLAHQPQIEHLRTQAQTLRQDLPLFTECAQLTKKITQTRQDLRNARDHQDQHQQAIDQLTEQIHQLNDHLAANDDLAGQEKQLGQQQRQVDQLTRDGQDLTKLITQRTEIRTQLSHQQASLTTVNAAVVKQADRLADLKDTFARYQIARLAKDLKSGSPCPVCGSREHPAPAHLALTHSVITDAQLKTATTQLTELRDKQSRLQEQVQQATDQLTALDKQVAVATKWVVDQLGVATLPTDWATRVQATRDHLQKLAHHLDHQRQAVDHAHHQLQKRQAQLATHQQALAKFADQAHQLAQSLAQQTATLTEKQSRLPKGVVDAQAAQDRLKKWQQQIHDFADQLAQTDHRQQDLRQRVAVTQNSQQGNQQNIRQGQQKQAQRHQNLETALHTDHPGRGWEFWDWAAAQLPRLAKLRSIIDEYQTQLHDNQAHQGRLQKQIGGRAAPDLSATRHQLATAQATLSQSQHQLGQLSAQQKQLTTAVHQVTELARDHAASQHKLNAFQTLTDVVTGNTENHLSLERYVLQSYFQEVLEVANTQLARLTNGRYQFELSLTSHGAGAKWTGLEVNVYDDNAGRVRSARTLSGGESFMASLALALALCQTIQEQSGGISIDALFIDEGFGSLDQQALTDALHALQELEGHRMIGIISHVTELEEQIPEQLRVRSVNGRSKISYQHELPA